MAETITSLNDNDVLFGRGTAISKFVGNQNFRDLTEEWKQRYVEAAHNKEKSQIADNLYHYIINEKNGRFLRLADDSRPVEFVLECGEWTKVPKDLCLEKIKQALREKRIKPAASSTPESHESNGLVDELLMLNGHGSAVSGRQSTASLMMAPILPASVVSGRIGSMTLDPGMLLLQNQIQAALQIQQTTNLNSLYFQNQATLLPSLLNAFPNGGLPPQIVPHDPQARYLAGCMDPPERSNLPLAKTNVISQPVHTEQLANDSKPAALTTASSTTQEIDMEGAAIIALATLPLSNLPKFTEEQVAQERASTTETERAEILADMFGKFCNIESETGAHSRPDKRARKDLDAESVEFLVQYMRGELQRIPMHQKQAFLEAEAKSDAQEFCDARLERFLRCEGMNTKLAAERFVSYWEARREVYGPDKYTLPITLGGAMKDDIHALEAIDYRVLPQTDLSGRQLLYSVPHSRGGKGLTTQSLVRVFWYAVEIASHENTDVNSGYVQVVWNKDATVYDYDFQGYRRMMYFQQSCWPLKPVATHVCCSPRSSLSVIKPIVFAIMGKGGRSRSITHNVPESKIIGVLAQYGILGCMLPTEMGGTVEQCQSEWLAQRRAVEMEEIS